MLPLGHACKAWNEQLAPECSEAVGKHPTCVPQAVFLVCLPRPQGGVKGKVSFMAWQYRRGRAVSGVQLQHSGHLVVCGMEVLVLPHKSESC